MKTEPQEMTNLLTNGERATADVGEQTSNLRARCDAAHADIGEFWNKLLTIRPLVWGFDDGIIDAPWRTKSDECEDQIAELDRHIAELRHHRNELQS